MIVLAVLMLIYLAIYFFMKGVAKANYKQKKYGSQLGRWWW